MSHADRSDTELLTRARDGDPSAFAVLVHRHTPVLVAAAQSESTTPDEAAAMARAARTWRRALRRLRRAEVEDLEAWLLALQGTPIDADGRARAPLLPAAELDALWAELAARWPRGRRRVRVPAAVGYVAVVLVLLVMAVTLPAALLLTTGDGQDQLPPPTLTAVPVDGDEYDLTDEDL